jgi:hypothetical protein
MKLKVTEIAGKSYAEVQDGKPIFIDDDSKEVAFDVPHTKATITRLNGESKAFRERAEKAETSLKAFDGIEDPEAARKAIEVVAYLDSGKLLSAGKVEEIKAAAKKAAEDQVAAANKGYTEKLSVTEKERDTLRNDLYAEKIGGSFNRSKLITEKAAIPADMMQARFGGAFKIEDNRIVAYDQAGNKIFSRVKAGEVADFDEALETLIDQYPYRDQILKGANHSGSGARPGANGANGGKRTITRTEFAKLDPVAQRNAMVGKDAMTLVDG